MRHHGIGPAWKRHHGIGLEGHWHGGGPGRAAAGRPRLSSESESESESVPSLPYSHTGTGTQTEAKWPGSAGHAAGSNLTPSRIWPGRDVPPESKRYAFLSSCAAVERWAYRYADADYVAEPPKRMDEAALRRRHETYPL